VLTTTTPPIPFPDLPSRAADAILFLWGLGAWAAFDNTKQGFAMATLTAVAGPATEIVLINAFHLYAYTSPDFFGIPAWIPWVYFCGSPAVGLLSRAVRRELRCDFVLLRFARPTRAQTPRSGRFRNPTRATPFI